MRTRSSPNFIFSVKCCASRARDRSYIGVAHPEILNLKLFDRLPDYMPISKKMMNSPKFRRARVDVRPRYVPMVIGPTAKDGGFVQLVGHQEQVRLQHLLGKVTRNCCLAMLPVFHRSEEHTSELQSR